MVTNSVTLHCRQPSTGELCSCAENGTPIIYTNQEFTRERARKTPIVAGANDARGGIITNAAWTATTVQSPLGNLTQKLWERGVASHPACGREKPCSSHVKSAPKL
jgi:hypothetical protein